MAKKASTKRADRAASQARMKAGGLAAVWAPDEVPFIQAILADRFNNAPRLVFADWLEERGDPRAEFIRAQCRLMELHRDDDEYAPLLKRSQELIEKHRARWMKPYPRLPATVWGIDGEHFHRGLPAAVTPKSIPGFVNRAPLLIDELGVSAVKFYIDRTIQAEPLAKVPQLARLETIVVRGSAVGLAPLLAAPQLGPVRELRLPSSMCLRDCLPAFLARDHARVLRRLHLDNVQPEDLRPLAEWEHLRGVEEVSVPRGSFQSTFLLFLIFEHSRMRLRTFQCNLAGLAAEQPEQAIRRFAAAPLLCEANSFGLSAAPNSPALWSGLVLPPRVRALATGITTDAEALALLESPAIEPLEHLSVALAQLSDATVLALARSERLHNLRSLRLKPTFEAALALVQSPGRLERLKLVTPFTREQEAELLAKAGRVVPGERPLDVSFLARFD